MIAVTDMTYRGLLDSAEKMPRRAAPLTMIDAGFFASLLTNFFSLQTCLVYGEVRNERERLVVLERPRDMVLAMMKGYLGWGLSLQYRDRIIRIFYEIDVSSVNRGQGFRPGDPGMVYGLRVKSRQADFHFTGLYCGQKFFALHGAEDLHPGICRAVLQTSQRRGKAGFRCSLERRNLSGRNDPLPRSLAREEIFCEYALSRKLTMTASGKNLQEDGGARLGNKMQARGGVTLNCKERASCRILGVYQRYDCWNSGSVAMTLSLRHRKLLRASVYYAPFFIEGKNTLYARVLPVKDAVSPGVFVRDSSHIAAGALTVDWRGMNLNGRYRIHFSGREVLSHQAEMLLSWSL